MGAKSLFYFEVVTTFALLLGLGITNWLRPGDGLPLNADAHTVLATPKPGWEIALHAFPSNVIEHAAKGDILPVVIFATRASEERFARRTGARVLRWLRAGDVQVHEHVYGAHADRRVRRDGLQREPHGLRGRRKRSRGWPAVVDVLKHSSVLVGSLYLSLSLILPFLLVFVMEKFGVPRRVGSFVIPIPTGYSFNLDGSTARRLDALPRARASRRRRASR